MSSPEPGFSQFHEFIKNYNRVELDPANCNPPKVSNRHLTVWVNVAEQWTQLPKSKVAKIFNSQLEGSICNLLFKNVFGLSSRYYQSFKHSLTGRTKLGANGLYVHKTNPKKFAIVVRMPVSFVSWPLASAALAASPFVIIPAVGLAMKKMK